MFSPHLSYNIPIVFEEENGFGEEGGGFSDTALKDLPELRAGQNHSPPLEEAHPENKVKEDTLEVDRDCKRLTDLSRPPSRRVGYQMGGEGSRGVTNTRKAASLGLGHVPSPKHKCEST